MERPQVLSALRRQYGAPWALTRLTSGARFWLHWLLWFVNVRSYEWSKRGCDTVLATLALVAVSPLMLLIAAAIKLTDRGPVFYHQWRVGKDGRLFPCPKFRSMRVDADKALAQLRVRNDHRESVTFKMKKDPRVTPIGRLLRRSSLDELPQFWCVVRGHMSLVGPRPAPPYEVAQYSGRARRRLSVRPGITCTWQVSGRGDIPFDRQVEMDLEYIEQRAFRHDLSLLVRTIPAVVGGKGAY
jgi:lipopolysaccharide/colanic/teichoic acid biosynthesis glycosyltransferase